MSGSKNAAGPEIAEKEHFDAQSHVVKLDKHGLPLSPQPSDDPEDPLNWPLLYRIFVLIQVSLLATLGTFNTAIINPAYGELAEEFGITTVQATVVIALNGIGPFLFIPLANAYGRRPVYLLTTFIGFVSALGCAYTKTYGELIGARIVNGIFPVALSLGAGTVADMFFLHQRGRAMGVYTVLLTNGSHLAPIFGGLIGQFLGWRWIFKFAAICDAFMFIFLVFFLPETLYLRESRPSLSGMERCGEVEGGGAENANVTAEKGLWKRHIDRLRYRGKFEGRDVRVKDFVLPIVEIARYPSVLFPALYYATQYGFGSILPAVTVSHIFAEKFGWQTLQIGLAYGGSLTIGSFLGETAGGWVVDAIIERARRRSGDDEDTPSEVRLKAVWTGELLVPAGLLIYGFGIQYGAAWPGPIIGMGVACFGVQCITTVISDCHRDRSAQVFNFFRQEIGMTFAFYAIPLATAMGGYQWLFILFAGIGSIVAFLPILFLMYRGEAVRAHMNP
ncbi:MFS general substrate transporter [Stereum hirsutum FP-91666 SS1]|uniref:MFS general substrate transporter n=1 Tax=Stereum hirsutum (strain FP-91666) TaxID=721885 RepID=UPI000440B610|nr:MFS general substrate transporter [Stereum hirsutum FP-91666 SS1]EIM91356.1 MFS general substrate transporter [Stereum hirsutum FP-91666 SS1]